MSPTATVDVTSPDDLAAGRPTGAATGDGGSVAPRTRQLDRLGMAVGVAVVVAFAVANVAATSLWLDEAYTVAAINDPWLSLTETHGTMGLYYVAMWAWGQVSVDGWWVRVPSVLFALGTLWVVRDVVRRIGGPRVAALAVPLVALQPLFELKAVEARSYSLMTLLVASAWALVLRGMADDRRRWVVLLAIVGAAGVMTHGLFIVHLAPIALLGVVTPQRRRLAQLLGPAVVIAATTAWVLRSSGGRSIGTYIDGGPLPWLAATLDACLQGPPVVRLLLLVGLVVGVRTVVVAIATARDADERLRSAVPLLWAFGAPAALAVMSLAFPLYNPRYLTPIAPALGVLLAFGVRGLPDLLGVTSRSAVRLRIGATAVIAGALAVGLVNPSVPPTADWRATTDVVAADLREGDALLFANLHRGEPEQHRPPFEVAWAERDHLPRPVVVSSRRPLGEARRYEDDQRTPAQMAAAARAHGRVWVVGADAGGSVSVDDLLDDPAFDGLVRVDSWTFHQEVEVRLYEWAG